MRAGEFELRDDISWGVEQGINVFRGNRVATFNTESIGLLRQQFIERLGWEEAREVLLQFGYRSGYSDLLELKTGYDFESPEELLKAGPKIHTDKGIVAAEPSEIRQDIEAGEFYFTGVWHNSYEAEQHLIHNDEADEPVCWTLMGYASGWCTAFLGFPVLAIEPQCVGQGDENCGWEIQPPEEWSDKAEPYRNALNEFFEEV